MIPLVKTQLKRVHVLIQHPGMFFRSLLHALGTCAEDMTKGTCPHRGVELRCAAHGQGPVAAAAARTAPVPTALSWFRELTTHSLPDPPPPALGMCPWAPPILHGPPLGRSHSFLWPSSCCLSVSCWSRLGWCRAGLLFLKQRVIILTLSPHTYQWGLPFVLTCLTQQLLRKRIINHRSNSWVRLF